MHVTHALALQHPPAPLAGLAASRRAAAALEFGIIAPIMALLTIFVFDVAKAVTLWQETWNAARSIGVSASALAIQADGAANITQDQAQQALSVIYAEMPWLRAGIATGHPAPGQVAPQTVSAVITSVSFQPSAACKKGCYVPQVEWSKAYDDAAGQFITTAALRNCGYLQVTPPRTPPSFASVPIQNVVQALAATNSSVPDPFLIVDVRLTFTPFFPRMLSYVAGPVTFWATAYVTPRSNDVSFSTSGSAGAPPPSWVTYTPTGAPDPGFRSCGTTSS